MCCDVFFNLWLHFALKTVILFDIVMIWVKRNDILQHDVMRIWWVIAVASNWTKQIGDGCVCLLFGCGRCI